MITIQLWKEHISNILFNSFISGGASELKHGSHSFKEKEFISASSRTFKKNKNTLE